MKEISSDKRLGRGLSALLSDSSKNKKPDSVVEKICNDDESVQIIPTTRIIAGIYQPRKHFDNEALAELSESIRENGIIQPIIVRTADERGTFEIVAGERRFKAAQMAGLPKVPVIVKNISNIQALEFAIIENVQRADLSPIEEAQGYKQLMDEFDYTQSQVSKKIGCSRSHIANILRMLSLPKEVQDMLEKEQITLGHAKAIMNNDNATESAQRIIKEQLTVRDAEVLFSENEQQYTPGRKHLVRDSGF
jgi:ParB family chromosome partitioning protein